MDKKRYIKFSLIGGAFLLVSFLLIQVVIKLNHKEEVKEKLSHLPNVELQDLSGDKTKLHDFILDEKIILAYINTECGICTDQMQAFKNVLPQLKNTSIILVSGQDIDSLKNYKTKNKIFKNPKIQLTHDYTEHFYMEFDIKATPHILMYDENGELLLNHKGYLKAEKILEILE